MRWLLLCTILIFHGALAEILAGRVVGIADGDTITVLDATRQPHKIRLSGIDAPERAQPFGSVSRKSLSDLVFNRDVQVEYGKRDRYGRIVGKVVANGQDVCLEQLRRGLAWHYKTYEKEQSPADRQTYAEAEVQVRERKIGLWVDREPIPPWDWRRNGR